MKRLALVVILGGCGGDECRVEDVDGTYLATTTEVSGTCGDAGSFVLQYNSGEEVVDSGCIVDYERLSDNQCTAERSVTCTSAADNRITKGSATVTSEPGGDRAEGIATMTVLNMTTGATVCVSTYEIVYERQ